MIRYAIGLILAVPLSVVAVAADAPAGKPSAAVSLEWIVGTWRGSGKIFGRNSEVSLIVKPVAGGSAFSLDYSASIPATVDEKGMTFSAHAFYTVARDSKWQGRWVDNFGNLHDIAATVEADAMTAIWGSPATEIGRSRYALSDGRLAITDWVLRKDGAFHEFATSSLKRD